MGSRSKYTPEVAFESADAVCFRLRVAMMRTGLVLCTGKTLRRAEG